MGTFSFPEDTPASATPLSPPTLTPADVEMIDVDDLDDAGSLPGTPPAAAAPSAGYTSLGYDGSLWWHDDDGHGEACGYSSPYNDEKVLDETFLNSVRTMPIGRYLDWVPPRAAGPRRVAFGSPLVRGHNNERVPAKGILKPPRSLPRPSPRTKLPKITLAKKTVIHAPEREVEEPVPPPNSGMTIAITQSITSVFSALKGYLFPVAQPVRGTLVQSSTAALESSPATRKRRAVELYPPGYRHISEHEYTRKRQKNQRDGFYTTATGSPGAPFTPEKIIPVPMSTATSQPKAAQEPEEAAMPAALNTGEDVDKAHSPKAREDANKARSTPRTDTWRKSFADEIRARKAFNEKAMAAEASRKALANYASLRKKGSRKFQPLTPPSSRPNTGDSSKAPAADFTAIETANAARTSPQEIRDKQIDDLIQRTVKHKLTPTRQTFAERKAAADAAKKQAEAEEERIAQELAAQKLAAEKQAAEEQAARDAEATKKRQIICDVSTISYEVILGELANAYPNKTISKIGSFLLNTISFQRVLASEDGTNSWLDDEAVNGWFYALCAAKNAQAGWTKDSDTPPPFACFNTAWFKTAKKSLKSIARWAKRQKIEGKKLLECERFFLPINSGAHWQLLIINGKDRSVEFLCSMGDPGTPLFDLAHKFLAQELGADYHRSEWTDLKRASNRSQSQSNSSDCGVFTCFNGLAAAQNTSYKEVTAKRMPMARKYLAAVLLNGGFEGDYEL